MTDHQFGSADPSVVAGVGRNRRVAFLFPGQGSQAPGMGKNLAEAHPAAAAIFEAADRALGFSLSDVCFTGSADDLKPTEVAQPALLACSVAALRCVESLGIAADVTAGHSLGEYSALVAAGVLQFTDAVRLVRKRGLWMAEAARENPGTMAAVLGLPASDVARICRGIGEDGEVVAANLNAPGQVVISGTIEAVQKASSAALAAGAGRVIPLAVSGAFHSPLMQSAADRMRRELQTVGMVDASAPVVSNTTAEPSRSADELRNALIDQIVSGVRWEESVAALDRAGATHYVEVGPGKVLCGLVKKIVPGAKTYSVADSAALEGLPAFLG